MDESRPESFREGVLVTLCAFGLFKMPVEGGPLGPDPQELHLLLAAGTWKFVSLRSVGLGRFPVPQRATSAPVHVKKH